MNKRDLISGAFWLLIALVVIHQAMDLKLGSYHAPGPGYIPLGVGFGMAAISVVIMIRAFRLAAGPRISWGGGNGRKLGLVLISLLFYALVFNELGFPLATFLFLFILFKWAEPQSWPRAILLSGGAALFAYVLFSIVLQCELPRGLPGI